MQTRLSTLENGLQVLLVDTGSFPSSTTLLLVGAGSRYETKESNGAAHFLEHMFFKGSKAYPNPYTVSSAIEGLGGTWNAFTSKDYTGYYIKAPNEHFDTVIDILSDILLRPLLETSEIEKEKGVITEEINMYEDMPQNKVGELYENLLYPKSPLGYDVIGTKETIQSFDRRTLGAYLHSYYHPSNAVLVVAGGLEEKDYMSRIEKSFGVWSKGIAGGFEKVQETQKKPEFLVYSKQTEQAHFCLGFRTFAANDPRRYTLSVLAAILGGGASSKLFTEVREKKGLCYYISTGRQSYEDCGYIVSQAGVPKDPKKVKIAIDAAIEEHKKMKKGEFTDDELRRAKEILKGHLILSLEDSYNVASAYGKRMLFEKKMYSSTEIVTHIEEVSRHDVQSLAEKLFIPESFNCSIIGPFETKDFSDFSFPL